MADYFECDICKTVLNTDKHYAVHKGRYKVCHPCYEIIGTIAHIPRDVVAHEACGGIVVSTTKELNEKQKGWCARLADEIMAILDYQRGNPLSDRIEKLLADACPSLIED